MSDTVNAWNTGLTESITLTNTSSTTVNGWSLVFTLPSGQTITQVWSARTSSTASPYTVTNESYNGALAPGASAMFGFLAASPGTGEATATCTRTP